MDRPHGIPQRHVGEVPETFSLMHGPVETTVFAVHVIEVCRHLESTVQGGIENPLLLFRAPLYTNGRKPVLPSVTSRRIQTLEGFVAASAPSWRVHWQHSRRRGPGGPRSPRPGGLSLEGNIGADIVAFGAVGPLRDIARRSTSQFRERTTEMGHEIDIKPVVAA
jgi:hypothetical protein